MMFKKRERDDPRIQLTGLVDILFLLIIFFTVTTTFATTGGIDVNLPQASSQRPLQKSEKLFVVIDRKGGAYIEGESMTDRELRERFREMVAEDAEAVVILQADKLTQHGRVVSVMDIAQGEGVKRLAIAAEQKPAEEEPDKGSGDEEEGGSGEESDGSR